MFERDKNIPQKQTHRKLKALQIQTLTLLKLGTNSRSYSKYLLESQNMLLFFRVQISNQLCPQNFATSKGYSFVREISKKKKKSLFSIISQTHNSPAV